jgi:hypothetical protein
MFTDGQMLDWVLVHSAYRVMGSDERGWVVMDNSNGLTFITDRHSTSREAIHAAMIKKGNVPDPRFSFHDFKSTDIDANHCHEQAIRALRYIGTYGRPAQGGSQFPNDECCFQIAHELELSFAVIKKEFGNVNQKNSTVS